MLLFNIVNHIEYVANGTITSPKGFSAGATYAGIKKNGENVLDLSILYSREPCKVAGVFTTNKIKSPAVVINQQRLHNNGNFFAIVANSGCANCSTGDQGFADAIETTEIVAKALGIEPTEVLIASTGVIGVCLPMNSIRDRVTTVVLSPHGGHDFTRAIMTTDTAMKEIAVIVKMNDAAFTIGGAAKGSGMIHPDLATMLVFLTTDAAVTPDFLESTLNSAVNQSFNMISVDGDTSPSDTVLLLANGTAGNKPITKNSELAKSFQEALNRVCIHLAKAIARDGEGATKLIEVTIHGSANFEEARKAARTIVSSNLVKAAIYGNDPNWGRISAALGRSGIEVNEAKLDIKLAGIPVFQNGKPLPFNHRAAVNALQQKDISIMVDLHLGPVTATAWGCDLTEEYVVINSAYTT